MRFIRDAQQKRMPWKNGGGETIEIARTPQHSTLDTFDWRISRARVDGSGPFSPFPGIDRTLAILDGEGIALRFSDSDSVIVSQHTPPLAFSGETKVDADLVNGTITDLNVMTRREGLRHRLTAFAKGQSASVSMRDNTVVAILSTGPAIVEWSKGNDRLSANDAALLAAADGVVNAVPEHHARLFLIEIWPVIAAR